MEKVVFRERNNCLSEHAKLTIFLLPQTNLISQDPFPQLIGTWVATHVNSPLQLYFFQASWTNGSQWVVDERSASSILGQPRIAACGTCHSPFLCRWAYLMLCPCRFERGAWGKAALLFCCLQKSTSGFLASNKRAALLEVKLVVWGSSAGCVEEGKGSFPSEM